MTRILRILLLTTAVFMTVWILHKIKRLKVRMQDAIFWVMFSAILLFMALFPKVVYMISAHLGFMSASNFIFVLIIFLLIEKIFTLSIIVSQNQEKIDILTAELALRSYSDDQRIKELEKEKDKKNEAKS